MKILALIFLGAAGLSEVFAASQTKEDPHVIGGDLTWNLYSVMVSVFDKNNPTKPIRLFQGTEIRYRTKIPGELKTLVITAAEALQGLDGDSTLQVTGIKPGNSVPKRLETIKFRIHPEFNHRTMAHNIAFFDPAASYVYTDVPELPNYDENLEGKNVEIPSYTIPKCAEEGGVCNYKLRSINTTVISPIWCKILYPLSPIRNTHICLSGWGRKGLSKEDIGAPLVYRDAQRTLRIAAIATLARSWSPWLNFPLELTTIKPYLKWINEEAENMWS